MLSLDAVWTLGTLVPDDDNDRLWVDYLANLSTAKPEYVRIETMSGAEKVNTSLIGPYNEGSVITLVCISGGGKPVAQLSWYNSSVPLQGESFPFSHPTHYYVKLIYL